MLNINWKEFQLTDLFTVSGSKTTKIEDLIDYGPGPFPYVTTKASNNGVDGFYNFYTEEGNVITIDSAVLGFASYQSKPFSASDHVEILHPKFDMDEDIGLFVCTCLNFECYRFSYGRKRSQKQLKTSLISLPACENGEPDFNLMRSLIQRIKYKKSGSDNLWNNKKTSLKATDEVISSKKCKMYKISDLFTVKYGINMELNALEETTVDDPDAIPFVSRTEDNNGVSAYVKKVEGKEPQPAETITVAGGGSVLSTFVQKQPFYSGRDLYLLISKYEGMDIYSKLYICTIIKQNKYKYNYGRQANKTLPDIELLLPSLDNGDPDFCAMKNYILTIPFSDKI